MIFLFLRTCYNIKNRVIEVHFMKCSNCGFISSKPFYRCPYCGAVHESEANLLDRSVKVNSNVSVRIKTVINVMVFNLLGIAILLDWIFNFQFAISFFAYVLFMGIFIGVNLYNSKHNFFSILMGTDLYLIVGLAIAWCYQYVPAARGYVAYIPTFVIPVFIITSNIVSAFLLAIFAGKKKVRPLWFEVVLLIHLLLSSLVFIFFMICRYNLGGGTAFDYMAFGSTPSSFTTMFIIEQVLIFTAFGSSILFIINYNLILIGYIFRQVKGSYGK